MSTKQLYTDFPDEHGYNNPQQQQKIYFYKLNSGTHKKRFLIQP